MQGPTRNGSRAGYRWRNNPASKSPERFIQLSKRLIARILFNRHFYKPQPMRSLEEIRADILALERETEGLLAEVIGGGPL